VDTTEVLGIKNMGIIGSGCEIMRYAWPKLEVSFSICENGEMVPSDLDEPAVARTGPTLERAPGQLSGGFVGDRARKLQTTPTYSLTRTMGGHGGVCASRKATKSSHCWTILDNRIG